MISRQATINVGTIGHVAHGKSTIVKSLSGIDTGKFGREKQRNMTIKLGYANAKVKQIVSCLTSIDKPCICHFHNIDNIL